MADTHPRPPGARPIPGPPGRPLVGNLLDLPRGRMIRTMTDLALEHGPMMKINVLGGDRYVASGLAMFDDLCDESRFAKFVATPQRTLGGALPTRGLFTSESDDPLWKSAHEILLPAFSMRSIRGYTPMMVDIADQLMLKWERLNPGEPVDVTADTTRLTLDTIALCGFGYRFNSFYRDSQHPFVEAMMVMLAEGQARLRIPSAVANLRRRAQRRFDASVGLMTSTVQGIIDERRGSGDPGDDLLGCMLVGVDKDGARLPDRDIVSQCITFLIAGHETTSGLLSFAIHYLSRHPEIAERARAEVDEVLGTDPTVPPSDAQLGRLTYIAQILDETLRLWPTAPAFFRRPLEDTTVGGYEFAAGTPIMALSIALHRRKDVWGGDADRFDPDHFTPERRADLPPNAFKPFGTGARACIGRQFALREAVLVLAMVVQRFDLVADPDYELDVRESITIKPQGLLITVKPRRGLTPGSSPRPAVVGAHDGSALESSAAADAAPAVDGHRTPLLVLFGSNLGAAEDIARRIARDGADRGWATSVAGLDDRVDDLPRDGAVVIVSASYNGMPPDNAARFCSWVQDASATAARGVRYTVFGCGNRDWASTYQAVPTMIDAKLEAAGATRVRRRGEGDARGDFDAQFQDWYDGLFDDLAVGCGLPAAATAAAPGVGPRLTMQLENRRTASPVVRSFKAAPAVVRVNRELTARAGTPGGRSVRHLEIALPAGVGYGVGDHLGVLPRNDVALLNRVIARFGLDAGQYLTLHARGDAPTHLPTGEPYPLLAVLGGCVELQDVATRPQLAAMAAHLPEGPARQELGDLAANGDESRARYRERIAAPRRTFLELLEAHPDCALPFVEFLDLLPALRPRYYSISSAPSVSPQAAVTVGVLDEPARSGHGRYRGVCSHHLAQTPEGGTVFVVVREPTIAFHPPDNPHLPMIMVGAGTGMAPFRGFLQDRGALKAQAVPIAESLLVLGCRDPQDDLLYAEELADFEKEGVARLLTACSRVPGYPHRYVQHVLEANADDVWDLLQHDAVVYVCGNASTMAPAVRAALGAVFRAKTGASGPDADAWLAGLRSSGRYLEDIWGETAVV